MTAYFQLTEPSQTDTGGHTPGKWEARELFADDEPAQSMGLFIYTETNARGQFDPIASLSGIGFEDFANAHLIAAAPELLAALEWIVDAFGHYCEGDPSHDEVQALQRAFQVIAKARGKA